jgi:hypothetical protein
MLESVHVVVQAKPYKMIVCVPIWFLCSTSINKINTQKHIHEYKYIYIYIYSYNYIYIYIIVSLSIYIYMEDC